MSLVFSVFLPVKVPTVAKSRLRLDDTDAHGRLVRAFVLDTIAALSQSALVSSIHVICSDPTIDLGVPVLPDEGQGSLNEALERAVARVPPADGVAALLPDLPSVRTDEIDAALSQCLAGRHFVADHTGAGTTMLTAYDAPLAPAFGADSAARHRASGAVPVLGDLQGLRLDVDTVDDLAAAVGLGVGKSTAAALPRRATPPQQGVSG